MVIITINDNGKMMMTEMINQPSEVTMMASLREVFTLFKEAANVSAPILNKVNIQPRRR